MTGCRTLPDAARQADTLALLPPDQSAYVLIHPERVPGFADALAGESAAETETDTADRANGAGATGSGTGNSEQRDLVRNLLLRSREIAFSTAPSGGAFAARGAYPRGGIGWSLRWDREWERTSAAVEGREVRYWRHTSGTMELVAPTRELLLGAIGGEPGASAHRLLHAPASGPVPPEAAAAMYGTGIGLYTSDPAGLLPPSTEAEGVEESRTDGQPPQGAAEGPRERGLLSSLRTLLQNRLMDSIESILLLADPGDSPESLSARIELGFESENAARISLVLVRLSMPNLLAELRGLGLASQVASTDSGDEGSSEGSLRAAGDETEDGGASGTAPGGSAGVGQMPSVEREGSTIRVGPIALDSGAVARRTLPLFTPLR